IGRAAIGNPWVFNQMKHFFEKGSHLPPPTIEERVNVVKRHLDFSVRWKGERLGILEMRRHYSNYFRGLPNFKPVRTQLVESLSLVEINSLLEGLTEQYAGVLAA
ncbi:MAG TPA: tRNA-dihydrouridine synthase, partial [Cyclobacteriaceae bacterium]|nr:tRNA-dihydrouridine synthase [Cyclobacteriaceae bacterium]